jgi:hypothetical protein
MRQLYVVAVRRWEAFDIRIEGCVSECRIERPRLHLCKGVATESRMQGLSVQMGFGAVKARTGWPSSGT